MDQGLQSRASRVMFRSDHFGFRPGSGGRIMCQGSSTRGQQLGNINSEILNGCEGQRIVLEDWLCSAGGQKSRVRPGDLGDDRLGIRG